MEALNSRIAALESRLSETIVTNDYEDPPLFFTKSDGSPVNPESFEKIPGVVKDLPVFSGDPSELNSWINDVDGLIRLYQTTSNHNEEQQNKFHMVCKFIRRKIRGEANDALVASNVGINWHMIRRTLITYYGEKRDLETLDFQLMSVYQKGRSLEVYYDEVNRLLSLIANQIKTDERFTHPEASKAMIETYNKKAIDAFIRGLDGDVYKFIRNYEPTSLAAAYSYCISFQNLECRKMLTRPKHVNIPPSAPRNLIPLPIPHPPPRMFQNHYRPMTPNNMRPHFVSNQPVQNHARNFTQRPTWNQPNQTRPFFQRTGFNQPNFRQNRPEPMEVDRSIRSHQVNYANRPNSSNVRPLKRQRAFNLETFAEERNPYEDESDSQSSYERYMRNIEKQEKFNEASCEAELNFLE
uniref:Retrotransposon gag domain-containing protein n=2 Tax=Anopheles atroparvus TaxID=41427 RepID=A0AAG5CS66_ANOAO